MWKVSPVVYDKSGWEVSPVVCDKSGWEVPPVVCDKSGREVSPVVYGGFVTSRVWKCLLWFMVGL